MKQLERSFVPLFSFEGSVESDVRSSGLCFLVPYCKILESQVHVIFLVYITCWEKFQVHLEYFKRCFFLSESVNMFMQPAI